nr:phosphoribosyl-AMP cyclohydrolase [Actinoplanes sp. TFC3]
MPVTEFDNQPARPSSLDPAIAAKLKRSSGGLIAAIVREDASGDVLMLAWMDDEALHRTLTTGRATYWSRSRNEYWVKGATSGHFQHVRSVALDCDGDALLVTVDQVGAACHTGEHTCFHTALPLAESTALPPAGNAEGAEEAEQAEKASTASTVEHEEPRESA